MHMCMVYEVLAGNAQSMHAHIVQHINPVLICTASLQRINLLPTASFGKRCTGTHTHTHIHTHTNTHTHTRVNYQDIRLQP